MLRFPNWKWFPSSVSRKPSDLQSVVAIQTRPGLPSVEKLDSRVLLSTTPTPSSETGGIQQVVMGLIADGIKLTGSEYAALGTIPSSHKHIAGVKYEDVTALGQEFVKLDQALFNYGEDVLGQKVTPNEQGDVSQELNDIFVKIDSVATEVDQFTDGLLLPAVQKVREAAMGDGSVAKVDLLNGGLFGDLRNLQLSGLVGQVPSDDLLRYAKIGDEFIKIDQALIDFKVDVILGAPIDDQVKVALDKVNQEFIKIKLEDVVISTPNQVPSDFLDGLQGEINGLITGNTIGGTGGGDNLV